MIALAPTPVLHSARLTLRAPVAADWPHWRDFAASDRARFVGGPLHEDKSWRAFCHVIGMWVLRGYGTFVFHETGSDTPLGMCGPWHPVDWPETELGWTLWHPEAEGKGLAFEAATATRDHAFRDLGWTTAVSYIDPANARSIALAERLGARLDPAALQPDPGKPCLVYRHPAPGGQA
ncbi:GNAT family N-acetyltransferase [Fertoebacter nigrum]|uniref:GNAT family N-acetyltransferase n=1 Tax=Fertoeibacter niger TaxID=2656921 RepID=A0A8X8H0M4_9RHOB|nr:GNAT family N-acetyltransferase [Fertoeibacter niger]NUB44800.1 GNAT family N-acetyltransferase [Fertoeibacter niger]